MKQDICRKLHRCLKYSITRRWRMQLSDTPKVNAEQWRADLLSPHARNTYARKAEEDLRARKKDDDNENILCMSKDVSNRESFVGFVQSNKSTTSLKCTGISAYSTHITFMNLLYKVRKNKLRTSKLSVLTCQSALNTKKIFGIYPATLNRVHRYLAYWEPSFFKALRVISSSYCEAIQTAFECLNRKTEEL